MKLTFIVLRAIVFILFSTMYFYIIPSEITWGAGLSSSSQSDYGSFKTFEYLGKPGLIATVFDGYKEDVGRALGYDNEDTVSKKGNDFFCNVYMEKLKKVVVNESNDPLQSVLQETFFSYSECLKQEFQNYLNVWSSCIAAVIYDGRCYFGNLGDSRGFLKTKERVFFTNDHIYITNDKEQLYCKESLFDDEKVRKLFGQVENKIKPKKYSAAPEISRAFGYYSYKIYEENGKYQFLDNPVVRDEPEIFVHDISENSYIIIANCDFWGVIKLKVEDLIEKHLKDCGNHNLLAHALARCGAENTTVVFMAPELFFKKEPEELKKEPEELRCSDKPRDLIIKYGIFFMLLYGFFLLKSACD